MALPAKKLNQEEFLSKEAEDLIDHIADILAEEYVQLLKEQKEEKDESSNIR